MRLGFRAVETGFSRDYSLLCKGGPIRHHGCYVMHAWLAGMNKSLIVTVWVILLLFTCVFSVWRIKAYYRS